MKRATAILIAGLSLAGNAGAQAVDGPELARQIGDAAQLNIQGNPAAAEAAYDAILRLRPGNVDALVGRGNARAFQKRYPAAQEDFVAALALQPEHLGALVGLGYSHAWAGEYEAAARRFEQALKVAPQNVDALKGLAYIELWRGNPGEAANRFARVLAGAPDDSGAHVGLEQARRAQAEKQAIASSALTQTGATSAPPFSVPVPTDAPRQGASYEMTVFASRSQLPDKLSESGLRYGEIAVWPSPDLRLFAKYDDGLSRDNVAFVRQHVDAATRSLGGWFRWLGNYATSLEVGEREFPDGVGQRIYSAEQQFFLPRGYSARFGGWRGPRDDGRTEWSLHAGAGIPISNVWRIEPTAFYSRSGVPGEREWRLLLATSYDLANGWDVGAGLAGGETTANDRDRAIREGYLRASWKASEHVRLHALARRETVRDGDAISVFSLGLTLTWR